VDFEVAVSSHPARDNTGFDRGSSRDSDWGSDLED
jgi:hypothetical protein